MNNKNLISGMVMGAVVGSVASMLVSPPSKNTIRKAKNNVGKTIKTVGDIVDTFM